MTYWRRKEEEKNIIFKKSFFLAFIPISRKAARLTEDRARKKGERVLKPQFLETNLWTCSRGSKRNMCHLFSHECYSYRNNCGIERQEKAMGSFASSEWNLESWMFLINVFVKIHQGTLPIRRLIQETFLVQGLPKSFLTLIQPGFSLPENGNSSPALPH